MAGIRMTGPAEDLLLEEDLRVAVAASPAVEDRSAAEALREAGEYERALHTTGV